jgi:hypothetical protein
MNSDHLQMVTVEVVVMVVVVVVVAVVTLGPVFLVLTALY